MLKQGIKVLNVMQFCLPNFHNLFRPTRCCCIVITLSGFVILYNSLNFHRKTYFHYFLNSSVFSEHLSLFFQLHFFQHSEKTFLHSPSPSFSPSLFLILFLSLSPSPSLSHTHTHMHTKSL